MKSPKAYVPEPGLLHALLGLVTSEHLESHPKVGASSEGFVIQEILARLALTGAAGEVLRAAPESRESPAPSRTYYTHFSPTPSATMV